MYDGWNVIGERRAGSDDFVSYYTRGASLGGGIGGIISVHRNGTPEIYPNGYHTGDYFYHYNNRGDVVSVTNQSGAEVAHYRYDAFGNVEQKIGTFDSPYQFSTKEYDSVSGLIYYGFRYYSQEQGIWLSKDPLGYVKGLNLYNFVTNNPVRWVDPLGLRITNKTGHPILVKGEKGSNNYTILPPGQTSGPADGAIVGDKVIKVGTGVDVTIGIDPATGKYYADYDSYLTDLPLDAAENIYDLLRGKDTSGIYDYDSWTKKHSDWCK